MIKQKLQQIRKGEITAVENIENYLNRIKKENKKYNIVLHVNNKAIDQARDVDKKINQGKAGKLAGLGFLVKSNINVKGLIANCASKTLENYKASYNATVIEKLLGEDAIVLGMVNMDEFACGWTGETSAYGPCKNPSAIERVSGGSSSGSAAGVAAGFCDFSLGSDTGGSIRNPASFCGVVGMKPSYGNVSRYGLIDLSMSFDQIGPLGSSVSDCEVVYEVISGKDERDGMTRKESDFEDKNKGNHEKRNKKNKEKIKIGILNAEADKEIWDIVRKNVEKVCKENKWENKDFEIEHVNLGVQTYYPIVFVEFFSGTRKFDGRKYGFRIEDVCGEEVLRRILGGQEISKEEFAGRYYKRALLAKKVIEKEFEEAFKKFDVIIMPTVPKLPQKLGEYVSTDDLYNYDALTALANISEIPGISIPAGEIDGISVGMQILAKRGDDDFLFDVSKEFE